MKLLFTPQSPDVELNKRHAMAFIDPALYDGESTRALAVDEDGSVLLEILDASKNTLDRVKRAISMNDFWDVEIQILQDNSANGESSPLQTTSPSFRPAVAMSEGADA